MRYYISGAITGQHNYRKFFKDHIKSLKYYGLEGEIFDPTSVKWPKSAAWEDCMKYDIQKLMDCDCLILLPNWEGSKGVEVELYLCKKLGIEVKEFRMLMGELMNDAS